MAKKDQPTAAAFIPEHPTLVQLREIKPRVVVCLGATAAQAMLGKTFRVSRQRGELVTAPFAAHVLATVHPSSLLRMPDEESYKREKARFIDDLRRVALFTLG